MTVSNLASLCKTIVAGWFGWFRYGAADGDRTRNTRNGSPMLYQLNYCGMSVVPVGMAAYGEFVATYVAPTAA